MKVLLDIKDDKASFVLEVFKKFKFVKTKIITEANHMFLSDLKDAVDEVNLIKTEKFKGRPVEELLNEL